MKLTVQGAVYDLPDGMTALECLRSAGLDSDSILAVRFGTRMVELSETLSCDGTLEAVTLRDEEGRRVYERSLRFVMLLALRRLLPGQKVRIEYSVGRGALVLLPGRQPDEPFLSRLEAEMRAICSQDLPFLKKRWKLGDALRYFEEDGQEDKVALLKLRRLDYFDMYACGEMWEYFYGPMVPSTRYVRVFGLSLLGDGFVMRWPDPQRPDEASALRNSPKLLNVFRQSAEWCRILGISNVADLADIMRRREMRDVIRVNEALHEQAISDVAREIVSHGKRVILVAGPSSSGKTTFAGRLAVHLRVLGCKAWRVSLDDYYLSRYMLQREPDGSVDLEHIQALDVPLIRQHLADLLEGKEVTVPRYSFKTGLREAEGQPLRLGPDEAVILEGIHALNPAMIEKVDTGSVHRVFVSALTCLNLDDHNRIRTTDARLLRRLVRDHLFRGTPPSKTLGMWDSVRRGEEQWIFPWQEEADSMFNTALCYELPVLGHVAYPLIRSLPEGEPGHAHGAMLRKILNYVPDIDPAVMSEIPPLSLLREFIGGCTIDER